MKVSLALTDASLLDHYNAVSAWLEYDATPDAAHTANRRRPKCSPALLPPQRPARPLQAWGSQYGVIHYPISGSDYNE